MNAMSQRTRTHLCSLVVATTSLGACVLADVRPEAAVEIGPEELSAGHALVQQMEVTHGGADAWLGSTLVASDATDTWRNGMFRRVFTAFPQNEQDFRFSFEPGSGFESELTMVGGRRDGLTVRISGEDTARIEPDGRVRDRDRKYDLFYGAAIQYLMELPFRAGEADIIAHAGSTEIEEHSYDVLFVSWSDGTPDRDYDQYVLYLDPETSRLAFAEYTVRAAFKNTHGWMAYRDYTEVDGLLVPTRMEIGAGDLLRKDWIHAPTVESVEVTRGTTRGASGEPESQASR